MSADYTITIHVAEEAVTHHLVVSNSPALAARLALADFEAECGRLPPGSYVEVWWDADGEGRSGGVRYKNLDAVRTALPGDEPAAIEKISAAVRLSQTFEKWLSHEEAVVACRNVGVDLTCGGCAEAFYTGHFAGHDPGCRTENGDTCPKALAAAIRAGRP